MRDRIFISYAHEDKAWHDRFVDMLAPATMQDRVASTKPLAKVWSDASIQPGARWAPEIDEALARTRVALLLVSVDFWKSEFIQQNELPALREAAERKELTLLWVPITESMYERTELHALQATVSPEKPLYGLSEPEADNVIKQICMRMLNALGTASFVTHGQCDEFQRAVAEKIGPKYKILDQIAFGDSSVVYRARRTQAELAHDVDLDSETRRTDELGQLIAVKALVGSVLQRGIERRFREAVDTARKLRSPAYVRVIDDQLDGAPHCLLMDLVDGQKLDEVVPLSPPLPLRQIKTILLRLAEALAEAHQHRCLLRGLTPRNVRIDSRGEPRFSAFRFFSLLSEEGVSPGTFLVSHEACTYMTPEHFEGRCATTASDQYSLGLIGYELLTGQRIPMVTRAADLLDKPALFRDLERDERVAARSPELGGIVSTMLRVDPDDRWESMNEVVKALEGLSIANSRMDELRGIAAKSYLRIQASRARELRFYQSFYTALFQCLPEVKAFFPNTSEAMESQYEALNKAIKVLLDFDPGCEKSRRTLEAIARKHDRYKLTPRHLNAFHGTLLATLVVQGEADSNVQSAWNEVIQEGLRAMSSMLC